MQITARLAKPLLSGHRRQNRGQLAVLLCNGALLRALVVSRWR
jgi:hypothetical protein